MNIHTAWVLAPITLAAVLGFGPSATVGSAPEHTASFPTTTPLVEPAGDGPENAGFFEVFIRIDGLQGPVTVSGYEGWFDAQALQSDVFAPPRGQPGGSTVPPQRFIGNLATALPPLLSRFADGRAFASVDLAFVLPVFPRPIPVLTIRLRQVRVTEVLQREDGGGFSDNFASLTYDRIEWLTSHYESGRGWQINVNRAGWDVVNQQRF